MNGGSILILLGGIAGAASSLWAGILGERDSILKGSWVRRYHLPTILIAVSALASIGGGVWADRQSEQAERRYREATTGGGSACLLFPIFDRYGDEHGISVGGVGSATIYDVKARVFDQDTKLGRMVSVGDIFPHNAVVIPNPSQEIIKFGSHDYEILFTARNGSWKQDLKLRLINGRFYFATHTTWTSPVDGNEVIDDKPMTEYPVAMEPR